MSGASRIGLLCVLVLICTAACRDVGVSEGCRQKISPQLINELSISRARERKFRVVIRLNDSAGLTGAVPSVTVANKTAATGYLTTAEIQELCILRQVLYIDLPRQFHKLEHD